MYPQAIGEFPIKRKINIARRLRCRLLCKSHLALGVTLERKGVVYSQ